MKEWPMQFLRQWSHLHLLRRWAYLEAIHSFLQLWGLAFSSHPTVGSALYCCSACTVCPHPVSLLKAEILEVGLVAAAVAWSWFSVSWLWFFSLLLGWKPCACDGKMLQASLGRRVTMIGTMEFSPPWQWQVIQRENNVTKFVVKGRQDVKESPRRRLRR